MPPRAELPPLTPNAELPPAALNDERPAELPKAESPSNAPTASLPAAELEHGVFTDGRTTFSVRSTTTVPDQVRVHAITDDPAAYWVTVLTSVGGPSVDATWCGSWSDQSATWKAGLLAWTFHCYFNGTSRTLATPGPLQRPEGIHR